MGRRWRRAKSLSIEVCDPDARLLGRVLVYKTPTGLVAHRAVRMLRRGGSIWWITKGDGFWTPDRLPVNEEAVIGVVGSISTGAKTIRVKRSWWHVLAGSLGSLIWPPLWTEDRTNSSVDGSVKDLE